jgi:glycosyltransferase involved in cell wall biosynthesis
MEAKHKREIQSGEEFNNLFPVPQGEEILIKHDADVSETVAFIPKVVLETLSDTQKIAKLLKGNTLDETCENIWHFVYNHIQYSKDEEGIEQIRRPARSWHDRTRGVDCDCYTVFISSILTNLHIPHIYRITKYKNRSYFQHIYPIVPTEKGKYITIDCVVNEYNYEEPFTEKKDTPMKLHYLNGFETEESQSLMPIEGNVDTLDLMGNDDFEELGRVKKQGGILKKIGQGAKKVLHVTNKINPATALLRAGILASMKLNLMKIAGRLRFAYLSEEQAKAQDFDMAKFKKLKSILKKIEEIFYGAGGKPENLKKAILTGKGNKDKAVNGLGYLPDENYFDENTPLSALLSGIYEDEIMEGLGGLGEPVTGAAIAAASSAMALIAGLIKQIGGLKKGGKDVSSGEEGSPNEPVSVDDEGGGKSLRTASSSSSGDSGDAGGSSGEGFMGKAKTWVKENPIQAAAVAVGTGALIFVGIKHFTKKKNKGLSGVPYRKRKKKKSTSKRAYKKPIALL